MRVLHRVLAVTLVVLASLLLAAASPQEARKTPSLTPESRDYDQKHIHLDLEIEFDSRSVSGTCRITLAPLRDDFGEILLHSQDTTVFDVRVLPPGGAEAFPARSFRVTGGLLIVDLGRDFPKGEDLTLEIDYRATPSRGLYFFSPTDDHPEIPLQVWSQGEARNNRYWFPCYDQPDDRITSEIMARVPAPLEVISNGKMESVQTSDDGKHLRYHFRMDQRHVPYLVSLIAGEFDHQAVDWDGIPLHTYVPKGQGDLVETTFGRTAGMMDFFCDYTGQRYPYSRYSQTTVWEFIVGGMENTTATTLNLRALHDERTHIDYSADGLIAHELVHQWYGDLLTCLNWNELWLNEGFATYFTDLYFESVEGRESLLTRRRGSADSWTRRSTPQRRKKMREDREREVESKGESMRRVPLELPHGHNYGKGASVLHILRRVMGDEKFREGMRLYTASRKDTCVTSEQLRADLESVHGESLQGIFDEWVYGAGYPEFELEWEWIEAEKAGLLRVKQVQDETSGLFHVPVTVAFHHETPAGLVSDRKTIRIGKQEEEFRFPMEERPAIVRFDEGDWIPKKAEFPKSLEELEVQALHDPDVTGRLDAIDALAAMKEAAVPALAKVLAADPQEKVRTAAANRLGRIRSDGSLQALLDGLEDESAAVRGAAVGGLGAYPAEKVEGALIPLLQDDPSYAVQAAAARSLGRCKSKAAKDPLMAALGRGSYKQSVEVAAVGALADLGDVSVLPAVIEAVEGMSDSLGRSSIRRGAVRAMVRLGAEDRRTREVLLGLLDHPSRWTRFAAAGGLRQVGDAEMLPTLLAKARAEADDRIRKTLESAIQAIAERARKEAEAARAGKEEITEPAGEGEGLDPETKVKALEAKLAKKEAERARLEAEIEKLREELAR